MHQEGPSYPCMSSEPKQLLAQAKIILTKIIMKCFNHVLKQNFSDPSKRMGSCELLFFLSSH